MPDQQLLESVAGSLKHSAEATIMLFMTGLVALIISWIYVAWLVNRRMKDRYAGPVDVSILVTATAIFVVISAFAMPETYADYRDPKAAAMLKLHSDEQYSIRLGSRP